MKTTHAMHKDMSRLQSANRLLIIFLGLLCSLLSQFAGAEPEIYYVITDHLGTPQMLTDQNQAVVWQTEQTPFGEITQTTGSLTQPLRFPGQYADPETGYSYNYFRDYDPTLGRYVQSDPIGLGGWV